MKNIDYEYRTVDIVRRGGGEQLTNDFKKLNAQQQVPVLFIDNNYLVQSVVYLNQAVFWID